MASMIPFYWDFLLGFEAIKKQHINIYIYAHGYIYIYKYISTWSLLTPFYKPLQVAEDGFINLMGFIQHYHGRSLWIPRFRDGRALLGTFQLKVGKPSEEIRINEHKSGWWFEPNWNILINLDRYFQISGKIKHVPNRQPVNDILLRCTAFEKGSQSFPLLNPGTDAWGKCPSFLYFWKALSDIP